MIVQLDKRLATAMRQALAAREKRLAALAHLLDSVSPLSTLARGYAIVSDAEGDVVTSAEAARERERLRVRFSDDDVLTEVVEDE